MVSTKLIIISCIVVACVIFVIMYVKDSVNTVPYPIAYPISNYNPSRPVIDTPRLGGMHEVLPIKRCGFYQALKFSEEVNAQKIIEDHLNGDIVPSNIRCDVDCDNLFIAELYESYLVKFLLENVPLNMELIAIYKKIYDAIRKRIGNDKYNDMIAYWDDNGPMFPVNQKDRNWSNNNSMQTFENGNSINPYLLRQITGVSDFDPTTILLSADFLKTLNGALPLEFSAIRDYMFNNILKRARGYRTNSKNRVQPGTSKRDKILATESQIGIAEFDYPDLVLQKDTYYNPYPWVHPGRSQCGVSPLQGMYEHEAERVNIPIECGISGSTNYWIWTALFSGVNLTLRETRLFLLSAFMVLNADGGHSLMEVLSSATMSAIFWKDYLTYSKDRTLVPYIEGSNFASNLYQITKNINPLGNSKIITINIPKVANDIFNRKTDVYPFFDDKKVVPPEEAKLRMTIESYMLQENSRANMQFGTYSTFLNQLPEISNIRVKTINKLREYVQKYC